MTVTASDANSLTSCCSGSSKRTISASAAMDVARCGQCGQLWGSHKLTPEGKPWDETYLPSAFVAALKGRRDRQASEVVKMLRDAGASSPVLDYGSGQGAFLAALDATGMDAWGCDLDVDVPMGSNTRNPIIKVQEPWQIPNGDWGTVVMLDVLEHHPDPGAFLDTLKCRHLLLKLPTATGPAAAVARLAARLGRSGPLEQLFLSGENAPHYWLATQRGLQSLAASKGWKIVSQRRLPEVGRELPDRIRPTVNGFVRRSLMTIVGVATAAVGPVWSDTTLVLLERETATGQ